MVLVEGGEGEGVKVFEGFGRGVNSSLSTEEGISIGIDVSVGTGIGPANSIRAGCSLSLLSPMK